MVADICSHSDPVGTLVSSGNFELGKKAKISNRYHQVPHMTQDTTWENVNTQENTTYKRTKRLALSRQVIR